MEGLLEQRRRCLVVAVVLPALDIEVVLVVAFSLTFLSLIFLAEVATTTLVAGQSIVGNEFAHSDEVTQTECLVQLVVHALLSARHKQVGLKLVAQFFQFGQSGLQTLLGASHADILPHDVSQFLVDAVDRALALDAHDVIQVGLYSLLGLIKLGCVGRETWHSNLVAQVVLDGVRQHKVTIGQTLHQCRSTQTVGAVVAEVALTDSEQTLDAGLQLIVNPDTTHRVVDSRIDHHGIVVLLAIDLVGQFTRIDIGDLLVHVEEVAIALANHVDTQAVDGLAEVEEHGLASVVDTVTLVATLLGGAASHVARHEVTEGGITALQIIVAVLLRNVTTLDLASLQFLGVLDVLGHPDTTVITQRLAHQRQFRLLVAMHRDAGGMNLNISGIGKPCALAIASHCGRAVAGHGVGRQEVGVAITTGGDDHSVSCETLELASDQVTCDDATCSAVDDDHIVHLIAVVTLDLAHLDLTVQARVSTQQQLLSGLALGIECTAHLGTTERTVGQQTSILTRKGYTLCHTLVDDIV